MPGTPLTVTHVVPYYPPHEGGMERSAQQLVAHLPAEGIRPLVLTSRIPAAPDEPGVRRLAAIDVAHTPVMPALLPALLRLPAGGIVHVHVAQAFIPDLAALVARRRHQPVVAHYHLDVDPSGLFGALLRPYQRTLLRHTLRTADRVVVPTPDYGDIVRRSYGVVADRVVVVPGATTLPRAAAPRRAPGGRLRILSVGRLSDQKNHDLLLRAAHELGRRASGLDWTLDIVGTGELEPVLRRTVLELGLQDRVRLLGGGFDAAALTALYDEADLFALATRKESFGLVYAEAMARALPVVSTSAPGVRNVVVPGRNGLLTEHEPAALADAILSVAADPSLYERFSAQNLEDSARYSWPVVTAQFADLYRELATQYSSGVTGTTEPGKSTATWER